jgi:hypothetical protein
MALGSYVIPGRTKCEPAIQRLPLGIPGLSPQVGNADRRRIHDVQLHIGE